MIDLCISSDVKDATISRTGYGVALNSSIGRAARRSIGSGIGRSIYHLSALNQGGQLVAVC